MTIKSEEVVKEVISLSDAKRAIQSRRYFKTGAGQYGEGDKFLGLTQPVTRSLVKKYRDIKLKEIDGLISSSYHEIRLLALLILVYKFAKGDKTQKTIIFDYYLNNRRFINNWDLVDVTAPKIVGEYLINKDKSILYKFAGSSILWERRIAVLSTFAFIRNSQFKDTIKISKILLKDRYDLIHKATGWMLREVGKKDVNQLTGFLDKYASVMPRTMLRYAIEKFKPSNRQKYLDIKKII